MKTFEEALAGVIIAGDMKDLEKQLEAAVAVDHCRSRYRELIDQAAANPLIGNLITAMIASSNAGCMPAESAMMSMFVNGLICGIEMERNTECNVELS